MVYIPKIWKNSNPRQRRQLNISNLYADPSSNDNILRIDDPTSVFHNMPSEPSLPIKGAVIDYQKRPSAALDVPSALRSGKNNGATTGVLRLHQGPELRLQADAGNGNYAWIQNADPDIVFNDKQSWAIDIIVRFAYENDLSLWERLKKIDFCDDDAWKNMGFMIGLQNECTEDPSDNRTGYIGFDKWPTEDGAGRTINNMGVGHSWETPQILPERKIRANSDAFDPTMISSGYLAFGIRYDSGDEKFYFYFSDSIAPSFLIVFEGVDIGDVKDLNGNKYYLTFEVINGNEDVFVEMDLVYYTIFREIANGNSDDDI